MSGKLRVFISSTMKDHRRTNAARCAKRLISYNFEPVNAERPAIFDQEILGRARAGD